MVAEVKEPKFYIVRVQSNHERKIAEQIKFDMERNNNDMRLIVPVQSICSAKTTKKKIDGKKVDVVEKVYKDKILYPGYIFIETTHLGALLTTIKETPGFAKIMRNKEGGYDTLRRSEIEIMIKQEEVAKNPTLNDLYIVGEKIKIIAAPFSDIIGTLDYIDYNSNEVKISISIFKTTKSISLAINDIAKL